MLHEKVARKNLKQNDRPAVDGTDLYKGSLDACSVLHSAGNTNINIYNINGACDFFSHTNLNSGSVK